MSNVNTENSADSTQVRVDCALGTIKKTVRVTIEKELEIEIMPTLFGDRSEADFLAEFNKHLWKIDGMDDVIKYAATAAATGGCGYSHDGIGLVDSYFSTYPRVPDVKVKELYEDIETEFVSCKRVTR